MKHTIYFRCAAIACLLLSSDGTAASAADAIVNSSPHAAVQSVGVSAVRWTDGFWADRLETVRKRSIPAMWEIMKGTKYKPFYQNFLIAAGDAQGDFHGAPWNDGDFYKFLEAVCAVDTATRDPDLETILQMSIAAIGKAQRADGYIH